MSLAFTVIISSLFLIAFIAAIVWIGYLCVKTEDTQKEVEDLGVYSEPDHVRLEPQPGSRVHMERLENRFDVVQRYADPPSYSMSSPAPPPAKPKTEAQKRDDEDRERRAREDDERRRKEQDESHKRLMNMVTGDMLNTGIPGGLDFNVSTPL